MGDVYGLTRDQVLRLADVTNKVDQLQLRLEQLEGRRFMQRNNVVVGFLQSAITGVANLNSNPNSGTLDLYSYTSTGSASLGRSVTVYHFATVNATTDRWTMAKFDPVNKSWVLDYQACSTT